MNDHYEPESDTNRIADILGGLNRKLVCEHNVQPGKVARAYLAAAIQMQLEFHDSIPVAAAWLREMADELESDGTAPAAGMH